MCVATHDGRTAEVKVLLETEAVVLRGEIKATLPFARFSQVAAVDGELHLDGTILRIGEQAEKWARKILNPPTLLDKLGVKAGMRLVLLGFSDRSFLNGTECDTCLKESAEYDVVFF